MVIEWMLRKFQSLGVVLDERSSRLWAAFKALELEYGGALAVARVTGLAGEMSRVRNESNCTVKPHMRS